ncbi:hypothetical protein [Kitasatospora arboriphila]|uniref:Uncharacterized protein n=1 Tax=Kitasatospora arboriphila TaxID=258052 RepID=A0ABN1TJN5_9ACTN
MSLRFEMVFSCFLRDDTPEPVLDILRWHMGLCTDRDRTPAGEAGEADEHPHPLLTPGSDDHTYLAGGEFARMLRQSRGSRHARGLFVLVVWLDDLDDMLEGLAPILELLAPHVDEPGYGGYFREEFDVMPSSFMFHGGWDV